jgi:hypothetical protein
MKTRRRLWLAFLALGLAAVVIVAVVLGVQGHSPSAAKQQCRQFYVQPFCVQDASH